MRITDYLDQQVQFLERSMRSIKDVRVFDFNFVPEEPLMRQEVKPIIDASLRYMKTGIANHLFIFGSRGCGKTLTVKYVQRLLTQRGATICYVNCRQHNTSFKILAHLLHVRPRGCSLDELWHRFTDHHRGQLILVLDEVDLLSEKDRNKDLLYLLARSPRNYMAILLSNHPKFLNRLDESIRSSLQPELIHFRNYDADEIRHILEDRARVGLRGMKGGLLAQIAAMTARNTNSDARVAIKTLYYLAVEAADDLETVFERARRDLILDVVNDLNDHNIFVLQAAIDVKEPFVKNVYARYRSLSIQQSENPFSYVHFYSSLSYLQSIGLIALIATKITRTYTNRIQVLFPPEVVADVARVRWS